jgi:transcriptional regulator with XRE-family HTH domain
VTTESTGEVGAAAPTRLTYADRLGRVIMIRRAELRMGRRDLAIDAGISYPYLSEIENGIKEPSHKVLVGLGDALGMTSAQLEIATLALDPYRHPSVVVLAGQAETGEFDPEQRRVEGIADAKRRHW